MKYLLPGMVVLLVALASAQEPASTPLPTPSPAPGPPLAAPPVTPPSVQPDISLTTLHSSVPPYNDRGVLMVPLRSVLGFLGLQTSYSDGIMSVVRPAARSGELPVILTFRIGGQLAQLQEGGNLLPVRMPLPADQRLGNVFVPLRLLAGVFRATVEVSPEAEGRSAVLRYGGRGLIISTVPETGYRGAQTGKLTVTNGLGKALSLHLRGPVQLALELGARTSTTRSLPPGVYYYRAAATGMRTRSGRRRILPKVRTTWSWGRR